MNRAVFHTAVIFASLFAGLVLAISLANKSSASAPKCLARCVTLHREILTDERNGYRCWYELHPYYSDHKRGAWREWLCRK